MWVRVIWQEGMLAAGREEGREECQQKERDARFDQQALSSDRKTVQFNVSKAFIEISYNGTHLPTLSAVRLRRSSTLGSLKEAEGRLIAVHSFIVTERETDLCMCYLLARS